MRGHRRAYIHIGLVKTGTTSIQYAMAAGRHELLKQCFLYPRTGAPDGRSGHHCLAWALRDSPKLGAYCGRFGIPSFGNAVTELCDLHIVVSSEELSGISYRYAKIKALLSLFRNHEVYVVAYVREQAEFFNAFWVELVSDLNYQMSPSEFVQKCLEESRYDYNNWFKIWKDVLGARLIIRPFDPAVLVNGNVVDDFCSVVGIEGPLTSGRVEWKNRSMNANQIAATIGLLKRLDSIGMAPAALASSRRARVKGIMNRIVQDTELLDGDSFWGIDPGLVQQVRDQYCDSNKQFFSDYLGSKFSFSAADHVRHVTAIPYEELDRGLRGRLENRLLKELERDAATSAGAVGA